MMKRILGAAMLLMTYSLAAQNPISPMGVYIADPSARVSPDGRLCLYGSRDESPKYYCSDRHDLLWTDDMLTWHHEKDMFSWKTTLYAPDAAFRNGKAYLYFDVPDGTEYVAEGDSPSGPFTDAVAIEGLHQIDPCVFIDDDGQAYYYFGQFSAKVAKMNPDMKTLDMSTMKDGIADEANHGFHEGVFMFKRNGWYYLVYADISRKHRPTCIGYSMGKSPMGPFTYKGVIVDNSGCDPAVWNNHGSVVEYKGNWYVLYHRATHGCVSMRKACIEPIRFNRDGTINEVEMTSQGAGKPLDAFKPVDAARACKLGGNVRITGIEDRPDREILSGIRPGDTAVWKYIDFGKGADEAFILVKSETGGTITLRADKADGPLIGKIEVPARKNWQEIKATVSRTKGVHALWAEFSTAAETAADQEIFELDLIRFSKSLKKAPKNVLRIATFNNQYENKGKPWSGRRDRVWKLMAEQRWDIVGMQEPFWNQVADMDTTLADYSWIGCSTDGKIEDGYWHYNPIFYRKDRLELIDWGRFWFTETPEIPMSKSWDTHTSRFCVWGHFRDRKTGKDFFQFNCHFDHKGEVTRQNSSRLLLAKAREIAGDKPFFCNGDLNTVQGSHAVNILLEGGLSDTWADAELRENTDIQSWNDWKPVKRPDEPFNFDHIFISKGTKALSWKLVDTTYDGDYPSDHFPITVEWAF